MSPPTRQRRPATGRPANKTRNHHEAESDHDDTTLARVVTLTVSGLAGGGQLHDGDLEDLDAWREAGEHLADRGLVGIAPQDVLAELRKCRRPA